MLRRLLGPLPPLQAALAILAGVEGWALALLSPLPDGFPDWSGWVVVVVSVGVLLRGVLGLLGAIVAWIRQNRRSWIRRPQLELSAEVQRIPFSGQDDAGQSIVAQLADYLFVNVRNRAESPGSDAIAVLGHIRVYDEQGTERFRIRACWRQDVQLPNGKSVAATEVTIGPGLTEQLNASWKFASEERAWGLNNEAIAAAPGTWHDPRYVIPPGHYQVRVKVQGTNTGPSEARFDLANPGIGAPLTIGRPLRTGRREGR